MKWEKTAMQIIPAGKMCFLQSLTEKYCEFLGEKDPQTLLQQCEPDDTYQPSTIPNAAWFLKPQ